MKILILKNRVKINIEDDVQKLGAYMLKHDIAIQVTYKEIDLQFKSVYIKTQTGNWQYVLNSGDASSKVVKYAPGYDFVILALNGEEFGITRPSGAMHGILNGAVFININCDPVDDSINNTFLQLCHEIMHGLILKKNMQGAKIVDPMDVFYRDGQPMLYYKNDDPNAPDGNFAEAWKRLKESDKVVTLTRQLDTGIETLGELKYGEFSCKTLERPWKDNKPNISCIPKGTYRCRYNFSPKFMKYTYELQNVHKRSGIRIHSGNYFSDIQGCILLGTGYKDLNNDKQTDIINSKVTVKRLEDLLGKQDFTLVIN